MATLKQIENFIVLAQELHFGRAAEKLSIPQPALTIEIHRLEKSLGCLLFDRSKKRDIQLTEAGKVFLNKTRQIPSKVAEAERAAIQANSGERGDLSINMASIVYEQFAFSTLLSKFMTSYPRVKLQIFNSPTCYHSYQDILGRHMDIGFFAGPQDALERSGLSWLQLQTNTPVIGLPRTHPLAKKQILSMKDFGHCAFILPPKEDRDWLLQDLINSYRNCHKEKPQRAYEVSGSLEPRAMVAGGLGIGLFFPDPVHPLVHPEIVYRPLKEASQLAIFAAWQEDNLSPVLNNFLRILNQTLLEFKAQQKEQKN